MALNQAQAIAMAIALALAQTCDQALALACRWGGKKKLQERNALAAWNMGEFPLSKLEFEC